MEYELLLVVSREAVAVVCRFAIQDSPWTHVWKSLCGPEESL